MMVDTVASKARMCYVNECNAEKGDGQADKISTGEQISLTAVRPSNVPAAFAQYGQGRTRHVGM